MMDVQKSSFDKIYGLMYNYYYQHNRVADAEDVLKTLVRNDPKHATHILDLARHYARVGKSAEMKSTLQRILDNPKDFPQGAVWVGNFYVVIRDYSDAIATYDAAARSHANPKERAVYQDRIMFTLLAEGKDAEATQMAESLLKQDPANETALRLRADGWLAARLTR
jgi:tetratricopeptide (TPR) repeat protein